MIRRLVRTQTRLQPGAVRHLSSRQRLTLASLALVDFMSFCSMSVMAPFFPREAAAKGLSETMCGIVFSFYAVVMFLTSPLFGKFVSSPCLYTSLPIVYLDPETKCRHSIANPNFVTMNDEFDDVSSSNSDILIYIMMIITIS